VYTNNHKTVLRSIAYQNDVYQKRFFAEYCIVGIPHNTAI